MQRLHHIALGATDPDHLASWYADVFGLRETQRHHYDDERVRSVWLELGDATLMIEHTERERREVDGVDAGLFLLAFETTEAERAEMEERLRLAGAPIEDRTKYTSYARDPEGNRVAVSCYPVRPT